MSTIAAIATPFGRGGISVIRISGEEALEVASRMFIPAYGCDLKDTAGGKARYGRIISDGQVIDDGIATVFRAPKSFTGEDTVEISCHGGILLTERVLKSALDSGAQMAQAGEFTQRAFMNGKLDLTEAEAVIGLIDAENEEKLRLCASHASGVLSKRCEEIYEKMIKLLSAVYVKLDYPEEDLAEVSDSEFRVSLTQIISELEALAKTYKHGKAVSGGVKTALIGKPNAGKSSLLNALAGQEKAIVTSVPGTTRDVIEETVSAGRILLRLYDTAGLRESEDAVEKIGIQRAMKKADEAEMIFALLDNSEPLDEQDKKIIGLANEYAEQGKAVVFVLNKSDKETAFSEAQVSSFIAPATRICSLSAVTGQGVEELKALAESLFCEGYIDYTVTAVVANARQYSAVCEARDAASRALDAHCAGMGTDVCGLDLEAALAAIGQIDGRTVTNEITNEIFHNFCVGK